MWVGRVWLPETVPVVTTDEEECGVVLGVVRKGWLYGRGFLAIRNDADNPLDHFKMDVPVSVLPDVIATYHTHPATEGLLTPSPHDRAVSVDLGLYGLVIAPDGRLRTYLGRYTSPVAQTTTRKRLHP